MAKALKNLRKMSDEEIVQRHDNLAKNVQYSPNDLLKELQRRHENRQKQWVMRFTGIISLATVLNVAFFIYEVLT